MKRLFLIFLMLWLAQLPLEAQSAAVNTSHAGAITDLVFDSQRQLLFSAGQDGTVRVWNVAEKRLVRTLKVSHRPVLKLAVHPTEAQLSALVREGPEADTLTAWDFKQGRRVFTVESEKQIMHVAYSPLGSYLFYSVADYNSIIALNPKTGRVQPSAGRGFGIVSYFTVARNEANIMTYQPSGSLSYWEIRTGRLVKQVQAPADLKQIRISPNNRYIVAASGDLLVIVDLLSGEVVDRTRVAGIIDLSFSAAGNEIVGVVDTSLGPDAAAGSGTVLKKWYFGGRFLIELGMAQAAQVPGLCCLSYGEQNLYLADRAATIFVQSPAGDRQVLAEDVRLSIFAITFKDSTLTLATESQICIYDSDFFSSRYSEQEAAESEVREHRFPNPFSAPVGLAYLDSQRLLIWSRSEQEGRMAVLDTWYGGVQALPVRFESAIRQVAVSPEGIVVVEKSGRCRILDPATFAVTFQYLVPGMNKLIFTFQDMLVGGKTSLTTFGGPLLQVNRRTGETVPIQDPSLFVYDLLYSADTGLISLAVDQSQARIRTLLKAHSGYAFERSRVLQEFQGEDVGASLAYDRAGRIYTSLGYDTVEVFSDRRLGALEDSGLIPRDLFVHNDMVFSLNRDSSISAWDISTRKLIVNLFFFKNGSWAALTSSGGVRAADTARAFLSL